MTAASIIEIATSVSPLIATVLISIGATLLVLKKDMSSIKRRVERIEQMELSSRLAKIETDISWIRARLEKRL